METYQCDTIDVNGLAVQVCQKRVFRDTLTEHIEKIVKNEFWDEFDKIGKLDKSIRKSLKSQVPQQVNKYLDNNLTGSVRKEVENYLPTFLDNNDKINIILESHSRQLSNVLNNRSDLILKQVTDIEKLIADKAEEVVKNITSNEFYHEINKRYFEAMLDKANSKWKDFENVSNKHISSTLKEQIEKCNNNLNEFNEERCKLVDNQNKIKLLEEKLTTLKYTLYGGMWVIGSFYVLYKVTR